MSKKKSESNLYFSKQQENAVISYRDLLIILKRTDIYDKVERKNIIDKKNQIYRNFLKKPFKIMIESILMRYSIDWGMYTKDELVIMAESHLIEQMVKFNEKKVLKSGKKAKAYSYCQTIVRNYFRKVSKDNTNKRKKKQSVSMDSNEEGVDLENNYQHSYVIDDENYTEKMTDFLAYTIYKLENKINNDKSLKKDEKIAGMGIVTVLKNWDILFMEYSPKGNYDKKVTNKYTKEKILFLIKEYTGMTTKEFRKNMKVFKEFYGEFKIDFFSDDE